ncbi:MAG: hypothetical protein KF824_02425 [Fimbriimonadaceae bacterium]|nr:MAG: hypothetical protein KF824_02425 [Fimbriimonadaceae bacterium]
MDLQETLNKLHASALLLTPVDESVIELSGDDAKGWLQGQITQDISSLSEGDHVASCICSPTGQLLTIAHIYLRSGKMLLVTPHPQVILNLVENFVIMEDVTARIMASSLVSVQGKGAENLGEHYLPRDRTDFGGFDVLNPRENDLNYQTLNPTFLEPIEIAAGIPKLGVDTTAKTLPPELGPQFDSTYIHYQKGCYAGQEVLQRIHSRGHTNKTWVGLLSTSLLPIGEKVIFEGDEVGTVLRSTEHPELGFIATAMLKNSATEQGAQVRVGSEIATVKHFPLTRRK